MSDTISKSALLNTLESRISYQRRWGNPINIEIARELSAVVNEIQSGRFDTPKLPLASEDERKLGWTVSYDYMIQLVKKLEGHEDCPSLEGIELVLLAHHNIPIELVLSAHHNMPLPEPLKVEETE